MNPFATAIATPGSGINAVKYGQLEKLIHNVARAAIKAGLTPRDVAALYISDSILYASVVFGLMRVGIVTMSLTDPSLPEHIAVTAVVTDTLQAFTNGENVLTVNAFWLQGGGAPLDYERIYRTKDDDTCCIVLTSGSTGRRKGIALSHRMVGGRVSHYGYSKGRSFAQVAEMPKAVGFVLPHACVEVVDDNDAPLDFGKFGRIRCRSEFFERLTGDGLRKNPLSDRWWYSGDRGWLRNDGMLFVSR